MLHAIRFHGEAGTAAYFLKVARAPIYDFCSNNKTLRDIYEYVRPNPLADDFSADEAQHTLLLDGGNHDIAPARFIVVAHQDWEDQGVLLVEFDCDPLEKGTLGVMRVDVGVLPQCLAMLQRSNVNYSDLKASELDTKWSEPIPGYTGTDWQRRGYSMQK